MFGVEVRETTRSSVHIPTTIRFTSLLIPVGRSYAVQIMGFVRSRWICRENRYEEGCHQAPKLKLANHRLLCQLQTRFVSRFGASVWVSAVVSITLWSPHAFISTNNGPPHVYYTFSAPIKIIKHNDMPAGRVQKTRAPRDVPDLGNPDRKRVLNVLAQRRYSE